MVIVVVDMVDIFRGKDDNINRHVVIVIVIVIVIVFVDIDDIFRGRDDNTSQHIGRPGHQCCTRNGVHQHQNII